ncbi:amino acid transport protein [Acinetobacter sp. AS167]|uniref:amino acid transport protein n=1 Tax=Acinetobacter sp. AS167 TaxID=3127884 RepID=UPI003015B327
MNTASLFLGLIFSSIGFGYFIYGKIQRMNIPFICGMTLMIFPYFIENTMIMSVCGIILSLIPWLIRM